MGGVTTIALLERKRGISRALFSRYWRDVHGVMAARIPGFGSYTQYHVTPLVNPGSREPEPFEGIAIVTFADEADRQGLVSSDMTRHIHRDEQNLFRRALLYNLAEDAAQTLLHREGRPEATLFLVVAEGQDAAAVAADLSGSHMLTAHLYDLTSGDPAGWNDTDVDDGGRGRRFVGLIHTTWNYAEAARRYSLSVAAVTAGGVCGYLLDEHHVLVENGRPTSVGQLGLSSVRTIEES